MKNVIIILLMLFVNVLYSQDSLYIGDWARYTEYMDQEGNKHLHRVVVTINKDSTFKVISTHNTINVFSQIVESSFIISDGSWTEADSILQLQVKHKLTNEFEIKYFKNFPRLALVGYYEKKTHLVEVIYRWQSRAQSTELFRVKVDSKLEEFFKSNKRKETKL
jgi:hypothetical protein